MQTSDGSKIAFWIVIVALSNLAGVVFGQSPKEFTNSIGMKFVLISRGTFVMGTPRSEEIRTIWTATDKPQRKVTITRDFFLGVYEVTQSEYERVMGVNPSHYQGDYAQEKSSALPVENLTWTDAMEFCLRLSEMPEERKHKRFYRLPSEAEWEYACRAGTSTKYFFGDDDSVFGEYAWYVNNSGDELLDFEALRKEDNASARALANAVIKTFKNKCRTHSVGLKKPNPWGLFDIYGNVDEWCWTSYDDDEEYQDLHPRDGQIDPVNPDHGVSRGGGYMSDCLIQGRTAYREPALRDSRQIWTGFRVAMNLTSDHVHLKNDTTSDNDSPPER